MLSFLGKRLAQLIPTLFFVSVMIFLLQHLLPGDPALTIAGEARPGRAGADPRPVSPRPAVAAAILRLDRRRAERRPRRVDPHEGERA